MRRDLPHGASKYVNHACRCDICRAANTQRVAERRAARANAKMPPPEHGAAAYSNYGCRCEICRAANAENGKARRERLRRGVDDRPGDERPAELPRLLERPHGSTLLTRDEVADMLGYSRTSMATVMGRDPGRWPRPAALLRRGRAWLLLWDADEIRAAAPPAAAAIRAGSVATVSDPDGLLTCAECGRRLRSLGRHLQAAHDMTGDQYREHHQLPATAALHCDGMRQDASDRQLAAQADNPSVFDHLSPYQAPEHLDVLRSTAIEVHHETRSRDTVRAHRAPGQRYAVQVMAARRRELLDETARQAGYESLRDAIEATMGLSTREAASRIGVGASTVLRHRRAARPAPRQAGPLRDGRTEDMQHQTMTRNASGQLVSMDCPCGEDHGPSVDEERVWALEANDRLRAELA